MKRLYEKHNGKLIAVSEFRQSDKWREGYYFVEITKNARGYYKLIKESIEPDRKRVYAALKEFKQLLSDELAQASMMKIHNPVRLTKKQQTAWNKFNKIMGSEGCLYGDSINTICDNALAKFKEMIK